MMHSIKTDTKYFQDAIDGTKTFTVRKDDRDYKVGDILRKVEVETKYMGDPSARFVDPAKFNTKPTGREADFIITYKLNGGQFGIANGYCVLGLRHICDD